jgi:hypothetical protein
VACQSSWSVIFPLHDSIIQLGPFSLAFPSPLFPLFSLWELLAARPDLVLVTSDKLLLRDRAMRGRVITLQAFLAAA